MSDVLSFAEIDGQHGELLPTRTVLSLFNTSSSGGKDAGNHGIGSLFSWMNDALGHQVDSAGSGLGGQGGASNAGHGGANAS